MQVTAVEASMLEIGSDYTHYIINSIQCTCIYSMKTSAAVIS